MIDVTLQLDLGLRLLLSAALGGAIGYEREIHGHPAGIRTHMLVSLGSALFTVLSAYGFGAGTTTEPIDPTRIAAQIVTGIGFLGAGAILKDGVVIRGLTTAASLWATAAVGMAAGAGQPVIAVVATVIVLISLWPFNWIAARLHGSNLPEIQVHLSLRSVGALGQISGTLMNAKLEIASIQTNRQGRDRYRADIGIRGRQAAIASALETIDRLEGVDIVSTGQAD